MDMESFNSKIIVTATSVVCCLCFFASHCAITSAISQASKSPLIYVDIPRWENRTAYPRFIQFRDQLRRRLDEKTSRTVSASYRTANDTVISLQKDKDPSSSSSQETNSNDSLEQLLAERNNGIPTSKIPNGKTKTVFYTQAETERATGTGDDENQSPEYFMTTSQKHVINFPKDKTNPYNRLQINPDGTPVEEAVTTPQHNANDDEDAIIKKPKPAELVDGTKDNLDIGDRGEFSSSSGPPPSEDVAAKVKGAVPTFELTMQIIKLSHWEDDENAIFSPLSVATILSMLMLGAEGKTFTELSTQLSSHGHLPSAESEATYRYHDAFRGLMNYMKTYSGSNVTLSIASELFVDKGFSLKPEFKHELHKYYDAPLQSFDFGKEGVVFQNMINQWVREKTRNKIKSILDEPPSADTTMGIINAIYFKGLWEVPFSDKLTRKRDFHISPSHTVRVDTMLNIMELPYIDKDTYRMIALPYRENRTGFFIILPKGKEGVKDLKKVESALTVQSLNESISQMRISKLTVSLPKLKFSSDGKMHTILQNMGLSSLFSPSANLSRISSSPLFISNLLHRAVIEVNEKGTEASAVSFGAADRIIDDIPFACDKPFSFFIYHVKANTILFWGRVTRPDNLAI
ncbi:Serpin B9 [Orchesella cincta]|uniref:Serpin B9 n=1 Tax=Orchesella cincta TaxID=48709 RepID=A0A1D2NEP1_ORCCI|nr:Serpin B9 [Orchesella cincta]